MVFQARRFGTDRYDFNSNSGPIDNRLQSLNGEIALEYLINGDQAFLIQTHPGFYFSHTIRASAFDSPTDIGSAFVIVRDKVIGFLGITTSILRKYPVAPFGGILWHIDPKWDLKAILPQPRLIYKASRDLQVFAGGEFSGGAFRMDGTPDPAFRKLSGAVVNFYDYRAGAGVSYNLKIVTLEASGGYDFTRYFDFDRAGENFSTRGAPYIKASLHLDF